jgi:hypothetical protein
MPRRTELRGCTKCGERAVLGLYMGFYFFGSSQWRTQRRGTFPARGFCADCFLGIAKKRLSPGDFESLRRHFKDELTRTGEK